MSFLCDSWFFSCVLNHAVARMSRKDPWLAAGETSEPYVSTLPRTAGGDGRTGLLGDGVGEMCRAGRRSLS